MAPETQLRDIVMAEVLDQTDIVIMRALQEDARVTTIHIARELGVSEETVRRRVRRLRQNQQFSILGIPDPTKLGFVYQGLVGLHVDPDKVDEVSDALAALDEINKVAVVTGTFEVFAWVTTRTIEDLRYLLLSRIAQISGVQRTETFVELINKKRTHGVHIR